MSRVSPTKKCLNLPTDLTLYLKNKEEHGFTWVDLGTPLNIPENYIPWVFFRKIDKYKGKYSIKVHPQPREILDPPLILTP